MLLNVERAQAIMAKHRVDALVAFSPENVTYASDVDTLTHYVQRGFQVAVILRARPWHAALVFPIGDYSYLHHRPSWIDDVRLYGSHNITTSADTPDVVASDDVDGGLDRVLRGRHALESFVGTVVATLRDLGLAGGKIAMDSVGLPPSTDKELRGALSSAELVEGFALWREVRLIKTPAELARMRRAIAVNEAAFAAVYAQAKAGATERDLEQAYRQKVVDLGGLPAYWDSGAGPRSYAFRPSDDRRIEPGDVVRIDASCIVDRYWSDLGRVGWVGTVNDRMAAYYEALHEGVRAALDEIGPGVRPSALHRIVVDRVRTRGIPHYRRSHVGHGIGIEFYETPSLSATGAADPLLPHLTDVPLEPNMVINVEAPYYEIGFGGLQVEETVLVTEHGCECLSNLPYAFDTAG